MDYYKNFPNFYKNEFIQSIANKAKWTVSGKITPDAKGPAKVPIDMYSIIHEGGQIHGAKWPNEACLVTLPELITALPHAKNHAFYLEAMADKAVVLDVEQNCPEEILNKFLQMPYIYGEISMSGNGYHLVFPLPEKILYQYPVAAKRARWLENEHHYYEIHLAHYVTFTRNMLPPSPGTIQFEPFFEEFAAEQKEQITVKVNQVNIEVDTIPWSKDILQQLANTRLGKSPEDYASQSNYEYGWAGKLMRALERLLKAMEKKFDHDYTMEERAELLYHALKNKVPHRDKHDETRQKMPYLLYVTTTMLAKEEIKKHASDESDTKDANQSET